MDREVSHISELMVVLIAFSAVLSIIIFTIFIGNTMRSDSAEALTDVERSISYAYVQDLARGIVDNEMPSATAYNILTSYKDVILYEASGLDNGVRVIQTDDSILKEHLKGRVSLEIVELGSGSFIAFVQPLNLDGTTANTNIQGLKELADKYSLAYSSNDSSKTFALRDKYSLLND